GTAFAYVLYYRLLARIGATRISLVTYIIPLSGVFWGWAVLGERLAPSAFAGLVMILASVAAVGEMGLPSGSRANFDPFGWAGRLVPERTLHTAIRVFMVLVCSALLVVRAGDWDDYLVKPLWLMESMVYIVLIAAFIMRTTPRERSRGLAEIVLPGIGALLPFALLASQPAPFVLARPLLHRGVFWTMTLATALTVWGMWTLRRSFSVTVEARELVTKGPYRYVRHPIYLGEILAALAVTVWRLSVLSAAVLVAFTAVQMVRARMEEAKLDRNLPRYRQYASGTWWFWK
ncbi:MAG: EamA family transporter, partial [bacterium]